MGQQSIQSRSLPSSNLQGWQQLKTGTQSIIWRNKITNEQIQEYSFICHSNQDYNIQVNTMNFRLNHPYLVASKFILNGEVQDTLFRLSAKYQGRLFLERIVSRLGNLKKHMPIPEMLHVYYQVFKGFQSVVPHLGCFIVTQGMICLNSNHVIKIWISQDLRATIQSTAELKNECQMIKTILDVVEGKKDDNLHIDMRDLFKTRKVRTFSEAIAIIREYEKEYKITIPSKIQYGENSQYTGNIVKGRIIEGLPNSLTRSVNVPINASFSSHISNKTNHLTLSHIQQQRRVSIASPIKRPTKIIKPLTASPSPRIIKSNIRPCIPRQLSRSPIRNYNPSQARPKSNVSANRSVSARRIVGGHTSNKIWNIIHQTKNEIKNKSSLVSVGKNERVISRGSLSPTKSQKRVLSSYKTSPSEANLTNTQSSKVFGRPSQVKQVTPIFRTGLGFSPQSNTTEIYKQKLKTDYFNEPKSSFSYFNHLNKIDESLNVTQPIFSDCQDLIDKYLGTTKTFEFNTNLSNQVPKIVSGSTSSLINQIRSSGVDQREFLKNNLSKQIALTEDIINISNVNNSLNNYHELGNSLQTSNSHRQINPYIKTFTVSKQSDGINNMAGSSYSSVEQYKSYSVNIQQQLLSDLKKLKAKDMLEGKPQYV